MRLGWALGVLVFFAASLSAGVGNSQLDAFIETELPASAAPGLAYARIDHGEVSARGFGERVKGTAEDVTSDTPFPIGSVTKSFTALAIMQLLEAGKLSLEDPVSKHLPAFAGEPASKVTLRQLLNHTSGFSTIQGNSLHVDADVAQLGLIEYANILAHVAPLHAPGTIWQYSNLNYQILGAVIECASGQSYASYIEANIFKPLGMTHSAVVIGAVPPSTAIGHRPWFGSARAAAQSDRLAINAPTGGIVSSAQDMGRYLTMWLDGKDDIVKASTKALIVTPSGPASPTYGLGWSIDRAHKTIYHTGLVPGAEALASFSPSEAKGVVVMVNANSGLGFADNWYLINGVAARALGQIQEDDGSRFWPKMAYLSIVALPLLFVLFAIVSWRGRYSLRAKRHSKPGKLSLWFPLVAMVGLAWFLIALLPRVFGASIATLQLYQPDFALCLIITAIVAPAWAMLRLALAYT